MLVSCAAESCPVMKPAGTGLMTSSPPDPAQVVSLGQQLASDQYEQSFDLGDGQRDQAEIFGWLIVAGAGQDRGWRLSSGLGCGNRADRESGHGEHDMPQIGGVEPNLGMVESEVVFA